jgi:outer membrane protein assembly factor BamA
MTNRKFLSTFVILLCAALFVCFFISSVNAQLRARQIEMVDVQGNRIYTDEEILKHIKARAGQTLDEKRLQSDLQTLLKLGLFNKTNTRVFTEAGRRGGVKVIFQVLELPLLAEVKFAGLRYVAEQEIIAALREQKAEAKAGAPFEPEKLLKAARLIREHLVGRGLAEAKVSYTTEEKSATAIIVTFVIDEMQNDDEEQEDGRENNL